jgi:hypothetical protein
MHVSGAPIIRLRVLHEAIRKDEVRAHERGERGVITIGAKFFITRSSSRDA